MKESRLVENLVAIGISVAAVVMLLATFGLERIGFWFTSAINWEDADYIDVQLTDIVENTSMMGSDVELNFLISNSSGKKIQEYEIIAYYGAYSFEISSAFARDIMPYGTGAVKVDNIYDDDVIAELKGKNANDIDLTYRVYTLRADNEDVIDNGSWAKVWIILAVSVVCAILIWRDVVKVAWLRILLKIMMTPIFIVAIFVLLHSHATELQKEEERKKEAQERERSRRRY